jgi:signal transduction histidine kinase
MLASPHRAPPTALERRLDSGGETTEGYVALQFAIGLLCSALGAEALVVPARFIQSVLAPWPALIPFVSAWGLVFLGGGGALIAAAPLRLPRRAQLAAVAWCALLLLALASLRFAAGVWSDAALYGILAIGLAAEALYLRPWRMKWDGTSRLGPVLGAGSFAAGALLAVTTTDVLRGWYAALLCAGGAVLLVAQTPLCGRLARTLAHVASALTLIAYAVMVPWQQHDWTAVALYAGLGVALALEFFGRGRLRAATATSLRLRLVLTLIGVASLPLIAATIAIAAAAEAAAIADASADQQLAAIDVAQVIARADVDYRGLVTTIATRGGLGGLPPAQQHELLLGLVASNVFAFSTYDAAGQPSARSDDKAGRALAPGLVAETTRSAAASITSGQVPDTERPEFVFAAPLHAADGSIVGFIAAEIESDQLSTALERLGPGQRAGARSFVVGPDGRVLMHPDAATVNARLDMSLEPPVAAGLARMSPGTLQYRTGGVSYVAGFAPVPALGWVVVTSYPTATVLAGVRAGREVAFGLLVVAAAASAVLGALVAERFVRPLSELETAANRFANEEIATPLPFSSFAEVQHLATIFGRMRERLAARAAERELALAAAFQAGQAREEFLSVAAHELKTPIAALRGQAQLLMRRLDRAQAIEPARLGESLRRIDLQSRKLASLVEQLLDVARLERGRLTLEKQPVDLTSLVEEVVAAHPHHQRIVARLPEHEQVANLDKLRIEQILNNLVDNAIKFSPDGDHVTVSLEAVDDARLRLTVLDHGLGIPPEHRAGIFERFHQAHGASHRSGLGLGLYITRQIVELHGGTIGVDFPTSGGSCFIVDMPSTPSPSTSIA